jgi:hypothetical protein
MIEIEHHSGRPKQSETQWGAWQLPICVTLLLHGEIRKRCRLRAPQQRCYFKL